MELKPEYKQTEMGVIPEEWDVLQFKEQFNISAGGDVNRKLSSAEQDEAHPYPIYSNALSNQGLYGYCSYADHAAHSVTITARGVLGVATYRDHEYTAVGRVLVLEPKRQSAGLFLSEFINCRIKFAIESTGVPQLTAPQIGNYHIAIPPYPEQRAIAEALSGVDGLLGRLDRLIAKKRDLKQAAMQQLLTGQTRLPGFSGEWEVKRLREVAHIKTGNRNNQDKVDDGQYPFFVRSEVVEQINTYSHDGEAILVPGEGRIGNIFHYICGRFNVHQRVYAITQFKPEISARFVHLYMVKNFGTWAMQNNVKATVDSLRLPTFQTFEIRVPPTYAEQSAIAEVLTDMDAEIAVLEQRRDKT